MCVCMCKYLRLLECFFNFCLLVILNSFCFCLCLTSPGQNSTKYQILFNLTEMRSSLGTDLLSWAELRLQIKKPVMPNGTEQRLELYRGMGKQARYIGSRFVSRDMADRWLSFDVTQTLREWLQGTGKSQSSSPSSTSSSSFSNVGRML